MSGFFGAAQAASKRTGEVWELSYLPDPMWPGCAVADHRIASQTDPRYKRLYSKIGQTFRLAGDTYDTSTHFRFPDGTGFRKGATVSAPVLAPALYPLDDDGTVSSAFGETWLPMIAPGYQSFSLVGGSVVPGGITYIASQSAANSLVYANRKALVPGINTAAQLKITSCDSTFGGFVSIGISKMNAGGAVTGFARMGTAGNDSALTPAWEVMGLGGYQYGVTAPGTRAGNIAIYVNGDTGQVGWTINGTDQGYLAGFVIGPTERYSIGVVIDDGSWNAGTITGDFLTEAASITEPIPGIGADIADNLLTGGVTTCDVGTRTGSATSGGHSLSQAELPVIAPATVSALSYRGSATTGGFSKSGAIAANIAGGPADYDDVTITLEQGGSGTAHTHSLDPLACKFVVLVKL